MAAGGIFTWYGHSHIFRLFSHLYHAHYDQMLHLEQEAHLNTLLRHCTLLAKEFQVYMGVCYGGLMTAGSNECVDPGPQRAEHGLWGAG